MVDVMTIDTLGYVKKLEAAGMDRRLAEAHAEAMNEKVLPLLATEKGVRSLQGNMQAQLANLESRLDSKFANFESKIENLIWKHTVAIILAVIAIGGFFVRFVQ